MSWTCPGHYKVHVHGRDSPGRPVHGHCPVPLPALPIGIHMDKSAGSMWGIDNSIVVLMSSSRLLKSINSILEKYAGSGLNSISRIILRSDSCLARRPVG